MANKSRIWELDAFRGFSILCVILIHLLFDLRFFLQITLDSQVLFFIQQYGGTLFVILSGLCATLGRRSFRRGVLVFACGMVITLVTWAMARLGMADEAIVVRFGVLHLLGLCMMLWPLLRRLPLWAMAALGAVMVVLGYWFTGFRVESTWLFPLGLTAKGFSSSDFFPLLPHLGWFLLGAVAGRTAYAKKQTLLPRVHADAAPLRFLQWCGRQSLWIYLGHQPVLYGFVLILSMILK